MSKRPKKNDQASVGVWGDAVCSALRGDRQELVDMLRHHNKPPDDVLEFIAWLLDKRASHRPRLPAKFKELHSIARNPSLWDELRTGVANDENKGRVAVARCSRSIAIIRSPRFSTTGTTRISGWSKIKSRMDHTMGIPPWRLHDLRRTAATGMAEIGIAPHIVEAALNHVSSAKAGVAGTYNRAAYAQEKKEALQRWAEHVASLVAGA